MAKGKQSRLVIERELITQNVISSQEELQTLLLEHGFSVTQATLSRDIKALKIAKVPDMHGGYRYMPQNQPTVTRVAAIDDSDDVVRKGVKSIEFSGSLAVIKTRPGYASVVAEQIDSQKLKEIIGTLAGDDTVLLVIRENTQRIDVLRSLSTVVPNIQNRLI